MSDYSEVDHRRMREWYGKVVIKKEGESDQTFSVEALGFDKSDALAAVNNSLKGYKDKGYTLFSIKITTDEAPLLTEAEVLEMVANEA